MADISRRRFVQGVAMCGVGASLADDTSTRTVDSGTAIVESTIVVPLVGEWQFAIGPRDFGEAERWHHAPASGGWSSVAVPHTWQIYPQTAEYFGAAWYRRQFHVPETWAGKNVRIEFEAVYHTAHVWVNGHLVGKHERKGYTAFALDITSALRSGSNTLVVRVNNEFDDNMLPRGHSYDWSPDGGITRPVQLLVAPPVFIEKIVVDAQPNLAERSANLGVVISVRNTSETTVRVTTQYEVIEEATGNVATSQNSSAETVIEPDHSAQITMPPAVVAHPKLWHFDHPHLYQLVARIRTGDNIHEDVVTFGIRSFQVSHGGFSLNGERVRLMGVERMAGSHPAYGMAEPSSWIVHDHEDMKALNCVFTRVHWPQDRRVLDYCDRHGILIQEEVPAWGPETFSDQKSEPAPTLMQNGLEQLREMVLRDRNHPSIVAWGLCNEIDGKHPPAYKFAQRMCEEAGRLDPARLRTYASNSLNIDPGTDVSRLMDFVSWNEYYETWLGGSVAAIQPNLEAIRAAFPGKPIVISEYGYCECEKDRTGGDAARTRILREHDEVFRQEESVGGAIFFCYNDYRTHVGDKGTGVMKQRVHGVVDVYGARKPSFDALCQECSPIERFAISQDGEMFVAQILTRKSLPSYALQGWKLQWVVYGGSDLPVEQREFELPRLAPGGQCSVPIRFEHANPTRLRVEVLRPAGISAATIIKDLR